MFVVSDRIRLFGTTAAAVELIAKGISSTTAIWDASDFQRLLSPEIHHVDYLRYLCPFYRHLHYLLRLGPLLILP